MALSSFPTIAERVFEMVEEGQRAELRLRLAAPKNTGKNFVCPIQICGIHGDRVFEIAGEDSLQSLQLALSFAATLLQAKQEQGAQITWLGVSDLGL
ncbi:MAG: DUF6968 family protein [Candidatus Angelobacter sp.]